MPGALRKLLRPPSARVTNLTLLVALLLAFATGVGAVATGSPRGRWIVVAHGIAGIAIVLLVPWKGRVVRHGMHRSGAGRWPSVLLGVLVVITVVVGLGYATGVVRSIAGQYGLWVHVAAALALAPLLLWHVVARPVKPRKTDLSRRVLLRAGLIGSAAAVLWLAVDRAVRLAELPGARRRFTGSYEIGSFQPAAAPSTTWLDDTTPTIDPARWRLTVADLSGHSHELTLADLTAHSTRLRATLDCTSGWFTEHDWDGVPVSDLIPDTTGANSLLVHSVTGYQIRFPVTELDSLLLATGVDGQPLAARKGTPCGSWRPAGGGSGGSSGSTAWSSRPRPPGGSRRSR